MIALFQSCSVGLIGTGTNPESTKRDPKANPPIPLQQRTSPNLEGDNGPLGSSPTLPPISLNPTCSSQKRISTPLHADHCCHRSVLSTCKTCAYEYILAANHCMDCLCKGCTNRSGTQKIQTPIWAKLQQTKSSDCTKNKAQTQGEGPITRSQHMTELGKKTPSSNKSSLSPPPPCNTPNVPYALTNTASPRQNVPLDLDTNLRAVNLFLVDMIMFLMLTRRIHPKDKKDSPS